MSLLDRAKKVLEIEAATLLRLKDTLGDEFERAVEILSDCSGKVILTGIGKSGIICRKIAATLSSTGTPAFFLHPAEGAHGDLGVLSHGDAVVAVSNSGESSELLGLLPLIRRMELPLISITNVAGSTLGRRSDVTLTLAVEEEACPLNLAPMASTTATLALGDAIAAALMEKRGVSKDDFALVHPAGSLGRRLTLTLEDLMVSGEGIPAVTITSLMRNAIPEITGKGLGFTGVFSDGGDLEGIITDGDLRRAIESKGEFLDLKAGEVMSKGPKTAPKEMLAAEALQLIENHSITSLFVTGEGGKVEGVVHIHHLIKAGL